MHILSTLKKLFNKIKSGELDTEYFNVDTIITYVRN